MLPPQLKDINHHFADDIAWRELTSEWEVRHFYYTTITNDLLSNLEVYEGQGWTQISGADDPRLPENGRSIVMQLFDLLKL